PFPQILVEGLSELMLIDELIRAAGYADCIKIDDTVVRGLEYYTGPVYEIELTFPIQDGADGTPRFGSVGGGGRYDGLIARFRGESRRATGFAIGWSRLLSALACRAKVNVAPDPGSVVVTSFDRARVADYQRMVSALRNAGIPAELYLGSG